MAAQSQKSKTPEAAGWLAGGGVFAGFFAFLGASCCVLPIILVNLGLSSALAANLAVFARFRVWIVGVALALVVASIFFAYRDGRRPRPRVWISASAALLLIAAAWIFPHYEGALLRWLNL